MALQVTSEKVAKKMAEDVMKVVSGYLKKGLPKVYKNFKDYMWDFYPDLPWNSSANISIKHILMEKKFKPILEGVKKQFNFDLEKELQKALEANSISSTN